MDLYQEVTNRIMEQLESGNIPWEKPWISTGNAVSHATGKPYSLLNQMLLGRPGEYVTFKQCQAEGGKVRKGEKSQMVVFWKWIEEKDPDTEEVKQVLLILSVPRCSVCGGTSASYMKPASRKEYGRRGCKIKHYSN